MKTAIEKLFSLLGVCSDNSDEAARLQLIVSITQSPDYKELSSSVALQAPFQRFYSFAVLETLDNNTLMQREKLLHKLVSLHMQLTQCISSGNGPELTSKDSPDFTSSKSIAKLLKKITLAHKKTNYSNIGSENALEIFSDTTVRSARECFDMLPVSLTSQDFISEEDIRSCMGDTLFCIPIDQFEEVHRGFLTFAQKGEQTLRQETMRRKKHALLKIALTLLCFGTVFAFSQFGYFSESYTDVVYGVLSLASLVFMIWG